MRSTFPQVLLVVVAAGAAVAAQAQQPVQQEQAELKGVYSFVGALDGEATLFAARSGAQSGLEIHLPILRGDRIWTRPYGRLAVLMSDRSILALDHDSEVTFTQIAGSPDADDVDSLYVLHRGRLSLEVADHLVDSELPAVDTTNARIYAKQQGRYQVESDGDAWTEVAVVEGFAEVVTQRGSVIVRGGEALRVQGLDDPWIELQNGAGAAAAALDEWTDGHRASLAAYAAVDANGYGSALASHGNWVEIEDRQAWKPEVEDDWQPYSRGRWTHTPAGLYWVARDPWGPLTYHYGSWNLYPGHGWLWFPSAIYSPSHVYWYWGPSYVGWIPRGYYQRYYGGLGFGLRHGLYGWAGGFWDPFNTWIFCPSGYLGYGRGYTYGRSLRRRNPKLSRGIITTDTNGIDYRNWRNPDAARQVLLSKHPRLSESELPDVTDFVARRADLTESLQRRLVRDDTQSRSVTVTGGPSGSGSQGLVGVTAGGVRATPTARVTGAGGSSVSGVAVRRTAPGQLRPAGSGPAGSTPQLRRTGSVPTDAAEPSDAVTRVRRADTPKPASVSSGGVKAAPTPTAAVEANEPGQAGAEAPTRVVTPRSSGGTLDRSRRPTPGRRVLDAIRGRDAAPGQPRTAAPRVRATGAGQHTPAGHNSPHQGHNAANLKATVGFDTHQGHDAADLQGTVHPDTHPVRNAADLKAVDPADPHQGHAATDLQAIDPADPHAVHTAADLQTVVHPDPHPVHTATDLQAVVHSDAHPVHTAANLQTAVHAGPTDTVDTSNLLAAVVLAAGAQLLATVQLFRAEGFVAATNGVLIVATVQR